MTPVVLITGCSSGIGEALAREFHRRGCRVVATARRQGSLDTLGAEGMRTEKLDVTDADDIARVVGAVSEEEGGVDLLINNAGYALMGPTVDLPAAGLRFQMETNVLGPIALVRAVAPLMKRKGKGTIANIGSISGLVTTPFSGAYCASKAALHALSDALRMELAPFGIRVVTVQPGAVQSQFGQTAARTAGHSLMPGSWYKSVLAQIIARAELSQQRATPAALFARQLADALLRIDPPPIIRLGKMSLILPALKRLLPTTTLDRILRRKFGLDALKNIESNTERR